MRSSLVHWFAATSIILAAGGVRAGAPADVRADFIARAQQHIAEREYWASQSGAALQAPNRRHNLRTWFEPGGIRVHDRTAAGSPQLLDLRLARMGRGDSLAKVGEGEVSNREDRVEIRRPGIVEWYENGPEGLEQGFTLAQRPRGSGPLRLELGVGRARAALRGGAVALTTPTGRKLSYDKLVVRDAKGALVTATLEVPSHDRVQLVVHDADAVYPLVIDPILTEMADTQIESDQDQALLGSSVAAAGDINGDGYDDVIVGAEDFDAGQTDEGAAFVFLGSASGVAEGSLAIAHAQLESDQAGAELGEVASAGDVNGDGYDDVIVGAFDYNAGQSGEGAAFVFLGSASGIADGSPATAHAQLESNDTSAAMGSGVASAGDVNGDGYDDVIVGAKFYHDGTTAQGAAFVFLGSASGIADGNPNTAHAELESDQGDSSMGDTVASAGDVNGDGYSDVIVGAHLYNAGQSDEGAAFVFLGSSSGISDGSPATAHAQLEADQADAILGSTVASAGDVNGDGYTDVIVGAPNYDAGQENEGAAFVFLGSASGITDGTPANAHAQLESDQEDAILGESVASAGDVNSDGYADVIAGARLYDTGLEDAGVAFVFLGSASGIADGDPSTAVAQLESADGLGMGFSVASAGDVNGDGYSDVISGAPFYSNDESIEGTFLIFQGGASGMSDGNPGTASAQLESDQASASFGAVAGAGDVNGDGYSDVIVGAPNYDAGQTNEGAAFVFLGGSTGVADGDPGTAHAQLESNQASAGLGNSVASAGDVNGDGYSDVIVGAQLYDAGQNNEGGAFVFLGSNTGVADGNPGTAHAELQSNQTNAFFGATVAGAGDVNGDGYGDVLVGANGYDAGQADEGAAFVFHGSSTGIADGNPSTADAQLESDQTGGNAHRVASAGDVNGDGYADVILGATTYDAGETSEGAAFIFHGSNSGVGDGNPGNADAQLESDQAGAGLGGSVAGAGDINGDGYPDVIVGSGNYTNGENNEGAAFIFLGSGSGIADGDPSTAHAQLESNQASAVFGVVAPAGDVNGDGYADVIVGAINYDSGQTNEGAAFVFLGSDSGIADGNPSTAHAQLETDQASASFASVAGAGDVNGDGYADVIIGAGNYDAGESNEGAAFVFLGNDGNGRSILTRQLRGDSSGIGVQPWGKSAASSSFKVSQRASHPQGKGRVRLEIETCAAGLAFGHASCTTTLGTWTAVGGASSDVLLTESVSSLSSGTLYHWRVRVQLAPATGAIASDPAHGPWRRVSAQAVEADVRAGS